MKTIDQKSKTPTAVLALVIGLHLLYAAIYALQIIVYDAWDLLAPSARTTRWIAVSCLTAATLIVWYIWLNRINKRLSVNRLLRLLIFFDIVFASFNVFAQRGMAARAVILFSLPIVIAGFQKHKAAAKTTALICSIAYIATAVMYFNMHPSEGYQVELYGETGFYSAFLILLGSVIDRITGATK